MFSADLSWTEPGAERVGQRKERKARERTTSSSGAPSIAPSIKSSAKSSEASVNSASGEQDRELWWTASLRKAKSLRPLKKKSALRPGTSCSTVTERPRDSSSHIQSRHMEEEMPHNVRDPTLQPPWTYSTRFATRLPSGQTLDPPVFEVPELEGDISSRATISSGSRSSRKSRRSNIMDLEKGTNRCFRRPTVELERSRENERHGRDL
jgi:hypothetical protein